MFFVGIIKYKPNNGSVCFFIIIAGAAMTIAEGVAAVSHTRCGIDTFLLIIP